MKRTVRQRRGAGPRRRMRVGGSSWAAALFVALMLVGSHGYAEPPRLVVLASVDQLPRELLDRFAPLFGKGGFRRLMEHGADFSQAYQDHFVTETAPGHAGLLTGAYAIHHGIIGNHWYVRARGEYVTSVEDRAVATISPLGASPPAAGESGVSPRALRASTVGDVLRAGTGMRARVISIALKDRAAVFMGGWRPNAAYWFDSRTCAFVTSTYYVAGPPPWVRDFHATNPCAEYIGKPWEKLRPEVDYARFADPDDVGYESDAFGLGRAFPHPIREWLDPQVGEAARDRQRYHAVGASPFGNDLVLRFAEAAVEHGQLGEDEVPDLLALGFSSSDYVGHLYGPRSQEVMDVLLRLDRLLTELMRFLDRHVGSGRWLIVLTSDHGVAPVAESLEGAALLAERKDHYRFDVTQARQRVEKELRARFFGDRVPQGFGGFIEAWDGRTHPFVYLRSRAANELPGVVSDAQVRLAVRREIERLDGVARVYSRTQLDMLASSRDPVERRAYRSWNRPLGGDLLLQLEPYWVAAARPVAASHGSPYSYDTHVPLLFHGAGTHAGKHVRTVRLVDLAPTLSAILGIQPPPQSVGVPLPEAIR